MDLGLTGARALVTGASAGLGAAVARALGAEGAKVAVAARRAEMLDELTTDINGTPIQADLSTQDGPASAVAAAVEALGGLDLLLVNSGDPPPGKVEDVTDEQWQKAIDGTFWSTVRLVRAALPHLKASDKGSILIILSSSVREPIAALTTSNMLRPGLA